MLSRITSIKDQRIVDARSLNSPHSRTEKCLLEDDASIQWAIEAGIEIECAFVSDKLEEAKSLSVLQENKIKCYQVSEGILKKINQSKYLSPIIAIANHSTLIRKPVDASILRLDKIQDQGNLGTIIRTAHAFGITTIISNQKPFDLFNKKTITATRGLVFHTHYFAYDNTEHAVDDLNQKSYQLIATTPHTDTLVTDLDLNDNDKTVLIIGNETTGISEALLAKSDIKVKISMSKNVESLNASVAAGIFMFVLQTR